MRRAKSTPLEVAAILAALDCPFRLSRPRRSRRSIPTAARTSPGEKYDAADAAAIGPTWAALRKAAGGLAKPFDPGPAYVSFRPIYDGRQRPRRRNRKRPGRRETNGIGMDFRAVRNPGRLPRSAWARLGQISAMARRGRAVARPAMLPMRPCTASLRRFAPTLAHGWLADRSGAASRTSSAIFQGAIKRRVTVVCGRAGTTSADDRSLSCRARPSGRAVANASSSMGRPVGHMRRADARGLASRRRIAGQRTCSRRCWPYRPRWPGRCFI